MKTETILITDGHYFSFRQYDTFEIAMEKGKGLQAAGYSVYNSPTLDADMAQKWIGQQKKEQESEGRVFDGAGSFIE